MYSKSKSRVGRHRRSDGPGKSQPRSLPVATSPENGGSSMLRETVFSSEVRSFEYEKKTSRYETDVDSQVCTESCDVDVTYDLIEGGFCPPPTGLSVKAAAPALTGQPDSQTRLDDLLATTPVPPPMPEGEDDEDDEELGRGIDLDSVDNLRLGEEAGATQPQAHSVSGNLGGFTIGEYDGSPRRYRPRSSDVDKNNKGRVSQKHAQQQQLQAPKASPGSSRPPGFPQRVFPLNFNSAHSSPSSTSSSSATSSAATTNRRKKSSNTSTLTAGKRRDSHDSQSQQQVQEQQLQSEVVATKQNETTMNDVLLQFETAESAVAATTATGSSPEKSLPSEIGVINNSNGPPSTQSPLESSMIATTAVAINNTCMGASSRGLYDYQYEFSETRKVLDEFFKTPKEEKGSNVSRLENDLDYTLTRRSETESNQRDDIGRIQQQQRASPAIASNKPVFSKHPPSPLPASASAASSGAGSSGSTCGGDTGYATLNSPEASRVAASQQQQQHLLIQQQQPKQRLQLQQQQAVLDSRNFTLSPETTDCDSADIESEPGSVNEGSFHSSGPRLVMPVLEDGLSSGHASDLEEDVIYSR